MNKSLEGLMMKFQYFGDLMQRANSLEKTLMLGKIESMRKNGQGGVRRGAEDEMVGWHQQLDGYEFEQAPGDGEGQGSLLHCSPWGSQRIRHDLSTEQQDGIGYRGLCWTPRWNKNVANYSSAIGQRFNLLLLFGQT